MSTVCIYNVEVVKIKQNIGVSKLLIGNVHVIDNQNC